MADRLTPTVPRKTNGAKVLPPFTPFVRGYMKLEFNDSFRSPDLCENLSPVLS